MTRTSRKRSKAEEDPIEGRLKRIRRRRGRRALLRRLVLTALVVYVAFGVVFGIAMVEGNSMSPTMEDGDVALFLRVGVTYRTGDVVLVKMEDGTEYVKRIVGLPGQTVDIQEETGQVLIDGEELLEPYLYEGTYKKEGVDYPLTLGEDEYFVLGDNRGNSLDSRNYGPVRGEQLDGRLLFILFRWQG